MPRVGGVGIFRYSDAARSLQLSVRPFVKRLGEWDITKRTMGMNSPQRLTVGILGAGHIGKTLAQKLSAAGHSVKVANSRGPETIDRAALGSGAKAVSAAEAID